MQTMQRTGADPEKSIAAKAFHGKPAAAPGNHRAEVSYIFKPATVPI